MNYPKKIFRETLSIVFWSAVAVFTVLLSAESGFAQAKIENPLPNITSVGGLVQIFLEGAIKIGMPIVALAIIYCGFMFVAARGNPEKIKEAKKSLLYTVIGAAILLGSWGIAEIIDSTIKAL